MYAMADFLPKRRIGRSHEPARAVAGNSIPRVSRTCGTGALVVNLAPQLQGLRPRPGTRASRNSSRAGSSSGGRIIALPGHEVTDAATRVRMVAAVAGDQYVRMEAERGAANVSSSAELPALPSQKALPPSPAWRAYLTAGPVPLADPQRLRQPRRGSALATAPVPPISPPRFARRRHNPVQITASPRLHAEGRRGPSPPARSANPFHCLPLSPAACPP